MILSDEYTLTNEKHFVRDYAPLDHSGDINVVIEIPTGTNAKWEVNKTTGELKWEFRKGKPRVVSYLGYPGNYGMIPRTLLPKELGGDGDPLDVLVLGSALPRGSVVKAHAIGMLKLLDNGEQDDKIIAVLQNSDMGKISSIEELRHEFNGAAEIIETWFSNYKGPGKIESKGFTSVAEAEKVIRTAIEAYKQDVAEAKQIAPVQKAVPHSEHTTRNPQKKL
jgi:inorganic pyrophosphatase